MGGGGEIELSSKGSVCGGGERGGDEVEFRNKGIVGGEGRGVELRRRRRRGAGSRKE